MFLALIAAIPLHLAAAGAAVPAAADTAPNSSWQQVSPSDSPNYDSQAERNLLEKANSDRARAGLPVLKMDAGLVRAARAHAAEMAAQKHISHQFSGEPSPSDRIAALSSLHLERTGENVAVAPNVDRSEERRVGKECSSRWGLAGCRKHEEEGLVEVDWMLVRWHWRVADVW